MIEVAAVAHNGQYTRDGKPYILHPLAVMAFLPADADEELKCIAVGHDLIEDTYVRINHLRFYGFTQRIIDGIVALTKVKGESYDTYKERVFANEDAMRVKMCDLRHNMDITRLNKTFAELTEKDYDRICRYMTFYMQIEDRLKPLTKTR